MSAREIAEREEDELRKIILDTLIWYSATVQACSTLPSNEVQNDRPFTGKEWIAHHLEGHHRNCHNAYRLSANHFNKLCDELEAKGVDCTGQVSLEEQVAMFLSIVGHGHVMRKVGYDFQHSTETVKRSFHKVLQGILLLRHDYIKSPITSDTPIHARVSEGTPYHAFKGALGAIDGTHIPAYADAGDKFGDRYINRKGERTQNVMVAVDFEGNILAVGAGWEGSVHDNLILRKAVEKGFVVPPGRYYLVDGGYANTPQFLAPYRNVTYHLAQFRARRTSNIGYQTAEELFNHRHAQLRNIVEKTFGILKGRFRMLVNMHPFSFKVQTDIVTACCIVHNFIKYHERLDQNPEDNTFEEQLTTNISSSSEGNEEDSGGPSTQVGSNLRDTIRDVLWANMSNN